MVEAGGECNGQRGGQKKAPRCEVLESPPVRSVRGPVGPAS